MIPNLPGIKDHNQNQIDNWRNDPRSIKKYQFLHHFIPHHSESSHGQRAKFLSHRSLVFYVLFFLFVFGLMRLVPLVAPGVLGYASDIYINELFERTNDTRSEEGLSPLKYNVALAKAAKEKAEDMFEKDYWAHNAPDGTEPWDFILSEGYDYAYAGENLAKNFQFSDEVVEAWYNSPSHRENLLSAKYDEVGLAVVDGILDGYETTLVVQMFGRVRTPAYVATIPEESEVQGLNEMQGIEVSEESAVSELIESEGGPTTYFEPVKEPIIDISSATQTMSVVFGGFIIGLLGVDLWYSHKHGVTKFTGHTVAHLAFLLMAFIGVWFALVPGKIL